MHGNATTDTAYKYSHEYLCEQQKTCASTFVHCAALCSTATGSAAKHKCFLQLFVERMGMLVPHLHWIPELAETLMATYRTGDECIDSLIVDILISIRDCLAEQPPHLSQALGPRAAPYDIRAQLRHITIWLGMNVWASRSASEAGSSRPSRAASVQGMPAEPLWRRPVRNRLQTIAHTAHSQASPTDSAASSRSTSPNTRHSGLFRGIGDLKQVGRALCDMHSSNTDTSWGIGTENDSIHSVASTVRPGLSPRPTVIAQAGVRNAAVVSTGMQTDDVLGNRLPAGVHLMQNMIMRQGPLRPVNIAAHCPVQVQLQVETDADPSEGASASAAPVCV